MDAMKIIFYLQQTISELEAEEPGLPLDTVSMLGRWGDVEWRLAARAAGAVDSPATREAVKRNFANRGSPPASLICALDVEPDWLAAEPSSVRRMMR